MSKLKTIEILSGSLCHLRYFLFLLSKYSFEILNRYFIRDRVTLSRR